MRDKLATVMLVPIFALAALDLIACDKLNQNKQVLTVRDREVGITVWHDDSNKVTCWIGPDNYTMVCLPDRMLDRDIEAIDAGNTATSAKRIVEERIEQSNDTIK